MNIELSMFDDKRSWLKELRFKISLWIMPESARLFLVPLAYAFIQELEDAKAADKSTFEITVCLKEKTKNEVPG